MHSFILWNRAKEAPKKETFLPRGKSQDELEKAGAFCTTTGNVLQMRSLMKKHVFFVLDYYAPHRWWSETVFENVISRLVKKGYQISVLTSHFDPSLPRYENIDHHLTIYRTAKSRLGFVFSAFFRGLAILRQHKDIDVIHTSTYGGAIPASLLGLFFHKKVILTVHEIFGKLRYTYKGRFGGLFYRVFERLIFCMPYTLYHCVSQNTMNDIRRVYRIPRTKIRMIYNGVDTEFRNPKHVSKSEISSRRSFHGRDDRFVVLYYGHAGKSKGLDYLVDAMPEVLDANRDILFAFNLIDSKRTEKTKLKIEDVKLKIKGQKNIQIFNWFTQEQLRTLVAAADLVVAPSLSEGFGSVHTETVALGKPLLTTTAWPIPEVVRWQVKMVHPRSAEQIAKGILGFAAGQTVQSIPAKVFSRDKTVEEIEKLYTE